MEDFARKIYETKYQKPGEDWVKTCWRVATEVFGAVDAPRPLVEATAQTFIARKGIPGGRYLYAAGLPVHQVNNCSLYGAEDSREGWSDLFRKASMSLMTGAGIGVVYSNIREEGAEIKGTGGIATGPIALMQILNEMGRGIMQGGSRRCLPEDTFVTMSDFSKKCIRDIQVGDKVLTRFGPRKVTNVFDQGEQEVYKIETEYGAVYSTKNHKWLCANGGRTKSFYIPVNKLSLSCKLYYHPVPVPGGEDIDIGWAYVLGFYLGNGCAYTSGRTSEVTFQVAKPRHNHKQVKFICDVMNKRFGIEAKTRRRHGEVTEIRCRGNDLVSIFQKYKSPNSSFVIPKEILEASLPARYAFLAGWFDADGCYSDSWKLANKWPSVRFEVRNFLKDAGFVSTLNGMEVRLSDYQRPLWKETVIPFSFKRPRGRTFTRTTSEIPANIYSISLEGGLVKTYDIEVEGVHEFIADDFVSHNSAIWAGLHWNHPDIEKFIHLKNWIEEVRDLKARDFNFPATMDMTNISVILDDDFFTAYRDNSHPQHVLASTVYWESVERMLKTSEPGFSIDIGENAGENLRNACTEITSYDDSDICNLISVNMAQIEDLRDMERVVNQVTAFALAGSVYSDVPHEEICAVREKNRRIGVGLMGLHEWLLVRGKKYGPDSELEEYLKTYKRCTDEAAKDWAHIWRLSVPVKKRAIAPTGTISIVAGPTTSGIEPLLCASYMRRYLKHKTWCEEYVIEPVAKRLVAQGMDPADIEDAYTIDTERRLEFQAWVQQYVDHAISSTINLPAWGTEKNNKQTLQYYGNLFMKYLPKLRGLTCYADGSRSGQPLTPVPYDEALKHTVSYGDVCDVSGSGGACGA